MLVNLVIQLILEFFCMWFPLRFKCIRNLSINSCDRIEVFSKYEPFIVKANKKSYSFLSAQFFCGL